MKIRKFEQSGFIIETDEGFKLAIDIGNKTPIETLSNINVDAFLISHVHGDHFSLPQIKALNPKVIYLNSECKLQVEDENLSLKVIKVNDFVQLNQDVTVKVFNVDHGPNVSSPLGENFGFLIEVENQNVYFAGDMFYESGIVITNLNVDYALIPVGGFYTFGPNEAFNFIKKFRSVKTVIPMHYDKTPETKGEFIKLSGQMFRINY
jgi:L-ascorbate metabolism protein UlaG (beta-lactamase superfamily)